MYVSAFLAARWSYTLKEMERQLFVLENCKLDLSVARAGEILFVVFPVKSDELVRQVRQLSLEIRRSADTIV
jgi:hypothetical protein